MSYQFFCLASQVLLINFFFSDRVFNQILQIRRQTQKDDDVYEEMPCVGGVTAQHQQVQGREPTSSAKGHVSSCFWGLMDPGMKPVGRNHVSIWSGIYLVMEGH